tara:strand:- start:446 stop:634 length:189 start_codon:yes stop_codon:yes gene_type:complete
MIGAGTGPGPGFEATHFAESGAKLADFCEFRLVEVCRSEDLSMGPGKYAGERIWRRFLTVLR